MMKAIPEAPGQPGDKELLKRVTQRCATAG